MATEQKTDGQEEKVVELTPTFGQKMFRSGWTRYTVCAHAENLDNPYKTEGTIGFSDAVGEKQACITMPIAEWIRVLTELAKKQAGK